MRAYEDFRVGGGGGLRSKDNQDRSCPAASASIAHGHWPANKTVLRERKSSSRETFYPSFCCFFGRGMVTEANKVG